MGKIVEAKYYSQRTAAANSEVWLDLHEVHPLRNNSHLKLHWLKHFFRAVHSHTKRVSQQKRIHVLLLHIGASEVECHRSEPMGVSPRGTSFVEPNL